MQEIVINGVTCKTKRTGNVKYGFERFWVWGIARNGRKCIVGQHSLPPHILDNGGKVYTSGNTYEVKKG